MTTGNERSRRTRRALLDATRAILEESGFEALTIKAVAERAGVTRAAVYLHFDSRAHLVNALFDHMAEVAGLADSLAPVWAAPDGATALEEWARHLARYHVELLAVDRAVQRVRDSDPDVAAHRAKVAKAKLANCRRLADRLVAEGRLAAPWTAATAADMLNALSTSDVVEGLIVDRRWSRRRFAEHLGALLRSTFVAAADRSVGSRAKRPRSD
ncbi:MAG TPA: helix-turn-helix domain-containing protein [Actinopolymorphaceae bacterium]